MSFIRSQQVFFFRPRYVWGKAGNIGDLIPVDFVANASIVAAVYCANSADLNVFHVTSSHRNPLQWGRARDYMEAFTNNHPPPKGLFPFFSFGWVLFFICCCCFSACSLRLAFHGTSLDILSFVLGESEASRGLVLSVCQQSIGKCSGSQQCCSTGKDYGKEQESRRDVSIFRQYRVDVHDNQVDENVQVTDPRRFKKQKSTKKKQ